MNTKNRKNYIRLTSSKGFTLVEVIVVLVLIGILSAIAIPNVNAYIDRTRIKEYVAASRLAEDTTMAIAGLQYAEVGNPFIGAPAFHTATASSWHGTWSRDYVLDPDKPIDETMPVSKSNPLIGKQYVYFDSLRYNYKVGAGNTSKLLIRMAPANLAADDANRDSAGIQEFIKRTGEPIPPPAKWAIHNEDRPGTRSDGSNNVVDSERQASFSVFLTEQGSNIPFGDESPSTYLGSGNMPKGKYIRYNFFGSWYNREFNGKFITVLHNFQLVGGGGEKDVIDSAGSGFENALRISEGWYIYEYKDYSVEGDVAVGGKYYLLDSVMQE